MLKFLRGLLALFLLCSPLVLLAQSAAPTHTDAQSDRIAKLEQQIADAKGSADNAWMLISSALVLMMTGPGLALFYGGLVRKKNVLATMMQSFTLMAMVTVLWAIVGYSLSFGEATVLSAAAQSFPARRWRAPDPDYAATIPEQTFMVYQLMFAIITPALITGAFAERMKFSAMVVFMVLWSFLVYGPMAHMVWGKGGLLNAAWADVSPRSISPAAPWCTSPPAFRRWCARLPGKAPRLSQTGHASPQRGAEFYWRCLLWVGWFGFNAGSALSAGSLATSAFVATHFAAAAARHRMGAGRMAAQRQAQCAGSDFRCCRRVGGDHARSGICRAHVRLAIGAIAGVFCYLMVAKVKARFGYDDSLDAFGVHGAGGTLGALLTGVFASSAVNPIFKDATGRVLASGARKGTHISS